MANLKIKNRDIDDFIHRKRKHLAEKSEKLSVKLEFHQKAAELIAKRFNQ